MEKEKVAGVQATAQAIQARPPQPKTPQLIMDRSEGVNGVLKLLLKDGEMVRYPTLEDLMVGLSEEVNNLVGEVNENHDGPLPVDVVAELLYELEERIYKRLGITGVEDDCEDIDG